MKTSCPQILIVDDALVELKAILAALGMAFPSCDVVALDSEMAFRNHVSCTRDSEIAVVIADAILGPLERGTDVLLFCRQRLPHVRRVLMSNKASREDLADAINRCQLDAYIEKNLLIEKQGLSLLTRLLADERSAGPVNDSAASKTCDDLKQIIVGSRAQAHLYKNAVKDLFAYAFYPWLTNPRTEMRIRNSTKDVDIVFQNAATKGILADLKSRYNSLLVPVETKNSRTLHSSYFSQLEAYLTGPIGKWGMLCFRGRVERKHLQQVKEAHKEGKLVMLLTDSELVDLARAKFSGRQSRDDYSATVDTFLRQKFAQSIG